MWPSLFMMRRTTSLTAILLAAALFALSATAHGASPQQIINDCSDSLDGSLAGSYTKGDLRRALKQLTGDVAEYTGCYDAITTALTYRPRRTGGDGSGGDTSTGGGDGGGGGIGGTSDGGSGTTGGGTGSGSTDPDDVVVPGGPPDGVAAPPTPQPGSAAPVDLGGTTVRPGSIPAISTAGNELPSTMVVFLVLLGAGAVGAVATTIGRRVLARRRA